MPAIYEEIVRSWYVRLRDNFTDILMDKYRNTSMDRADAENIYQDIFMAIQHNLEEGRIGENCDWRNYIIRVGLNMASKKYRIAGRTDSLDEAEQDDPERLSRREKRLQKVNEMLQKLQPDDTDNDIYRNPEAHALLGDELAHTPEPCASIIRGTYYSAMTDAELAEELPDYRDNGKPLEVNARAIRARRWLCMRDLIYRVKMALFNAGIIDEKPEKKKRNGK